MHCKLQCSKHLYILNWLYLFVTLCNWHVHAFFAYEAKWGRIKHVYAMTLYIYNTIMIQYHSMIRSECSIPHYIDINYRSRICRKQFLCGDPPNLRISKRFQEYKISHRVQPQHRATWHRISADSASLVGGNREESWNQALCRNVLCYVVLIQLGLLQWLLAHASIS